MEKEYMDKQYDSYWEQCWRKENQAQLYQYLDQYYGARGRVIEIFKEHKAVDVCDAACGFGAYSLAFASNGFHVYSFDISKTAVEITASGLSRYGFDAGHVKVSDILNTGYSDEMFDGVIAHAVLDHLLVADAKKALRELFRITKKNGLIMISFDVAEAEDNTAEHVLMEDGTMRYVDEPRKGMLFHPYEWEEIDELIKGHETVYKKETAREKVLVLQKTM